MNVYLTHEIFRQSMEFFWSSYINFIFFLPSTHTKKLFAYSSKANFSYIQGAFLAWKTQSLNRINVGDFNVFFFSCGMRCCPRSTVQILECCPFGFRHFFKLFIRNFPKSPIKSQRTTDPIINQRNIQFLTIIRLNFIWHDLRLSPKQHLTMIKSNISSSLINKSFAKFYGFAKGCRE